ALNETDVKREIPAPVLQGTADRSRPFWIGLPDNTVIGTSILVVDILPVPGFQIVRSGICSLIRAISAQTGHTIEAPDRLANPQHIGLAQKVGTRKDIRIPVIQLDDLILIGGKNEIGTPGKIVS